MAMNVQSSLQEAIERIATPAGAVLVALYAAVTLLQAAAMQDLMLWGMQLFVDFVAETEPGEAQQLEEDMAMFTDELHLALGLGVGPASALLLVAFVGSLVVLAMAIYAFGNEIDEPGETIPGGLGWTLVNLFVGSIVFGILVTIGLFMLVIPGIVMLILFLFWPVAVVLDGDWFGAGFASSVNVVTDNLMSTLGVVALLIVASVMQFVVGGVLGFVPGAAGEVLAQVVGAIVWVFVIALLARAYVGATGSARDGQEVVGDELDGDAAVR